MPLIGRIRRSYDDLPASERALADLLLEFPGDIAIYSATELAKRAKVSNAAVSRLMKRLQFDDYREARKVVRAAQASGQPIYLNNSLITSPTQARSFEHHLQQDMRNLQETLETIAVSDLAEAIDAIIGARTVWAVGFRNSYFFAGYLRRQLNQLRGEVHLVPQPGQVVMEELAGAGRKDLVAIVGLRRRVALIQPVMEYLRGKKVPMIYITDHRAAKTAALANWTFQCRTRGLSLFDSYASVVSLLNYICTEVAAEAGNAGRRRLKSIEAAFDVSGEIDPRN